MTNFIHKQMIDKKLCDKLIDYFESSEAKFKGTTGPEIYDPKLKQTTEVYFTPNDNYFNDYALQLKNVVSEYSKIFEYSDKTQYIWSLDPLIKIQKYSKGEGYHVWHNENTGSPDTNKRHLVFMTYLNDVKGGETGFLYQKLKIKPKKGLTLIWPAIWTHTHKGHIAKSDKYIITGYYNFK